MSAHDDQARTRRATLAELATLERHGLTVEPMGCGMGPVRHVYVLRDPEGATLQVDGHGGYSPTQWEAVAEGLRRIARGDYPTADPADDPPAIVGAYVVGVEHVDRRRVAGTVERTSACGLYVRTDAGRSVYLDASDGWCVTLAAPAA